MIGVRERSDGSINEDGSSIELGNVLLELAKFFFTCHLLPLKSGGVNDIHVSDALVLFVDSLPLLI